MIMKALPSTPLRPKHSLHKFTSSIDAETPPLKIVDRKIAPCQAIPNQKSYSFGFSFS